MTPRQRIEAILNRQPVDRFPVDYWCTPEVYDLLARHTGKSDEMELYRALGVDKIRWVHAPYLGPLRPLDKAGEAMSPWGQATFKVQSGAATYDERGYCPVMDMDDPDQLESYPWWPNPDLFDYDFLARECRHWGKDFALLGPWTSVFEIYCGMRGFEQALIDLYEEPDFLNAALDKIESIQATFIERCLISAGGLINMVFVSDDMGQQNEMMLSPALWKEQFQPRLRRWCDLIHRNGAKVFFHSDGAIRPIIPGLIEAGVDVLNPIQHACPGMDPEGLKRDFGDHLIFHGGVDTQKTLPFGTPGEVRAEVRHLIATLGSDGQGFIPASCHNMQAGTPIENVLAMIDEVKRGAS